MGCLQSSSAVCYDTTVAAWSTAMPYARVCVWAVWGLRQSVAWWAEKRVKKVVYGAVVGTVLYYFTVLSLVLF